MKKLGGILLMALGVALVLVAIVRAIDVVLIFSAIGSVSAYSMGALTGTVLVIVLCIALGVKSFKKGLSLLKSSESTGTTHT